MKNATDHSDLHKIKEILGLPRTEEPEDYVKST